MSRPTVAIVGRPNVGKSTLFNRIVGERIAIVLDEPGITRDRIYREAEWQNRQFFLVDTGGIEFGSDHPITEQIRLQAELAIEEADVIIFLVDGMSGITPADRELAERLYRADKPVVLAVNKLDNPQRYGHVYEFYELGFGEPVGISSEHALGIGELLDSVVKHFPPALEEDEDEDLIRICLIGRPNVGKSSLVNAILGEERVIVSPIAGTTRDAIDTPFEAEGQRYVLVDTAGIRKRGKVYEQTEKYSVLRALKALDRSDVALVVMDAQEGITEQDKHIAGYAHEAGKASIFVVNKWDAIEKDDKTYHQFLNRIRDQFQFMAYAPAVFVSAKTRQRIGRILPLVNQVAENHAMRIPTAVLNEVLADALVATPPPTDKGRRLRISYVTQVAVKPPTMVLFVNDPEIFHFSYQRYLENRFREAFQFTGTPIRMIIRKSASSD